MAADPNAVGQAFVTHFYQTFDNQAAGPQQLRSLYNASSMMTFEDQQLQGPDAIVQKLTAIGPVSHQIKSVDVQPSATQNAVIVFVTGSIKIGQDNPLHFCEMFHLVNTGPGAYYVHNEIFRLNYGL